MKLLLHTTHKNYVTNSQRLPRKISDMTDFDAYYSESKEGLPSREDHEWVDQLLGSFQNRQVLHCRINDGCIAMKQNKTKQTKKRRHYLHDG